LPLKEAKAAADQAISGCPRTSDLHRRAARTTSHRRS